jgi:predicted acetyltransferase
MIIMITIDQSDRYLWQMICSHDNMITEVDSTASQPSLALAES